GWVSSSLWNRIKPPLASTIAIATFQPFFRASASPAAAIFWAASSVMNFAVPSMIVLRTNSSRFPAKVQVLGDAPPLFAKRYFKQADSPFGLRQVEVFEIDVEQVDVPRQFNVGHDVGFDDLAGDRQGRVLRAVVNVAVTGRAQLLIFVGQEPLE